MYGTNTAYLSDVNNLNSFKFAVTLYAPVYGVVNNLEINHNVLEAKPDSRQVCNNDTVSACNKSKYTYGMCGVTAG
jgi:glycine cleavage system H lipoate-binding protein